VKPAWLLPKRASWLFQVMRGAQTPPVPNGHTCLQKAATCYTPPGARVCRRAGSDCLSSDEYSAFLPAFHAACRGGLMKWTEQCNTLRSQPCTPCDFPTFPLQFRPNVNSDYPAREPVVAHIPPAHLFHDSFQCGRIGEVRERIWQVVVFFKCLAEDRAE